jgi:AbrB family looped-hinge helix DNA binding protein
MAMRVRVTDDFLVAVPEEARQRLKIAQGDTLLVEIRDHEIVLTPEPSGHAHRLRGLHREVWEDIDVDEYIRQERGCATPG